MIGNALALIFCAIFVGAFIALTVDTIAHPEDYPHPYDEEV